MTNNSETATVTPQAARLAPPPAASTKATARKTKVPKARKRAEAATTTSKSKAPAKKESATKKDQAIAMLGRKNGATITEIMDKMCWARHTVRGFVAGAVKKAGFAVESFKSDKGERAYRIKV